MLPEINTSICDGCGLCVTICRCGALVLAGDKVKAVQTAECEWCTLCEAVCPKNAIRCPFDIVMEG